MLFERTLSVFLLKNLLQLIFHQRSKHCFFFFKIFSLESLTFYSQTWATAYGMAECPYVTSIVSSPGVMYLDGGGMQTGEVMIASRLSPLKVPVISHGVPMGALVVIADPESCKLLHGKIGEIWLAGPGVAEGYYNPQALDTDMFCASLVGDDEVSSEMSSFRFATLFFLFSLL